MPSGSVARAREPSVWHNARRLDSNEHFNPPSVHRGRAPDHEWLSGFERDRARVVIPPRPSMRYPVGPQPRCPSLLCCSPPARLMPTGCTSSRRPRPPRHRRGLFFLNPPAHIAPRAAVQSTSTTYGPWTQMIANDRSGTTMAARSAPLVFGFLATAPRGLVGVAVRAGRCREGRNTSGFVGGRGVAAGYAWLFGSWSSLGRRRRPYHYSKRHRRSPAWWPHGTRSWAMLLNDRLRRRHHPARSAASG